MLSVWMVVWKITELPPAPPPPLTLPTANNWLEKNKVCQIYIPTDCYESTKIGRVPPISSAPIRGRLVSTATVESTQKPTRTFDFARF